MDWLNYSFNHGQTSEIIIYKSSEEETESELKPENKHFGSNLINKKN